MTKRARYILIILMLTAAAAAVSRLAVKPPTPDAAELPALEQTAEISPDYKDITIPPNIAPLNFRILHDAAYYFVRIAGSGSQEPAIEIASRSANIVIDRSDWRRLLEDAAGGDISIDIMTADKPDRWHRYKPFEITVSTDPIDTHVAYRKLGPVYSYYSDVGIYQRCIESFDESMILSGTQYDQGCLNCHTFNSNNPDRMLLSIRSGQHGYITLLTDGDDVTTIANPVGDTVWHPSGKVVAFAKYDVRQFFHSARNEVHDVIEMDSLLGYFIVDGVKFKTAQSIANKDRLEKSPLWSPDGRWLYFLSAPKLWKPDTSFPPNEAREVRYDLMRVSYDIDTDEWGQPETVLAAAETHKSILTPRFTPDGRHIIFCMCGYSCFGIYQPDTDIYSLDVETGQYKKLTCNSDRTDSWHSISSNGRWMIFSSKRDDEVFTRLYITHLDDDCSTTRPFVLPQKDPEFYESYLKLYNLPEFITGPVTVDNGALVDAVRTRDRVQVDSITKASPRPTTEAPEIWQRVKH